MGKKSTSNKDHLLKCLITYNSVNYYSSWYKGILCKPKVFQKQIGHQAVKTKII